MDTPNPPPSGNPYVGPRSFRHGERLYGRDREARQLLDVLIAERIVLLHSPSGAGKTSLIEAALRDRLGEKKFHLLPTIRLNGQPPAGASRSNRYLFSTLLCLEEDERIPAANQLAVGELLELATPVPPADGSDDGLARGGLAAYLAKRWRPEGRRVPPVLIFDQFEEILTVCPTDRRAKREFFISLGEALRDSKLWALFAMREEYLAALAPYVRWVPTCLNTTFRLDLLTPEAARLAIQRPAAAAGVHFEDGAARELIRDLCRAGRSAPGDNADPEEGSYVEPVQLQVVCHGLWEQPRPDAGQITLRDVEAFGDVSRALGGYYAQRVSDIAAATGVLERNIRDWFDQKLITKQGIRRQVEHGAEQSEGLDNRAVEQLVNAHLVRPEVRHGVAWYELAHERLIEPVLRDNETWREKTLVPLQKRAALWALDPAQSETLVLKEKELEQAEAWAKQNQGAMNENDKKFLQACQTHREQSNARRRSRFVKRLLMALAGGALLVGLLVGLWARKVYVDKREAEKNAAIAGNRLVILRSQRLATVARNALNGDPEFSILLAKAGIERANAALEALGKVTAEEERKEAAEDAEGARRALQVELNYGLHSHRPSKALDGFEGDVNAVAFTADGKILAAVGSAPKPGKPVGIVWQVDEKGRVVRELYRLDRKPENERAHGHKDDVNVLAFSPDGKTLATGGDDNRVFLWKANEPTILGELSLDSTEGHRPGVLALAFSPDGQFLVAGGADGAVVLWDVEAQCGLGTLTALPGKVSAIAFNRTGDRLVAASANGTVVAWRRSEEGIFVPLSEKSVQPSPAVPSVNCLTFNPHWRPGAGGESAFLSGADDGSIQFWGLGSNVEIQKNYQLQSPDGQPVRHLAFSPDGRSLAAARRDTQIRVWEWGEKGTHSAVPVRLAGHTAIVTAVAFHPNGNVLASSSDDRKVRLWNLGPDPELPVLSGLPNFRCYAVSPDLDSFAGASSDLRMWELRTGKEQHVAIPNPLGPTTITSPSLGQVPAKLSVAISPDQSHVAIAGESGVVTVREANSGKEAVRLAPLGAVVFPVGQSPWGLLSSAASFHLHPHRIRDVVYSPDGKYIAAGGGNMVMLCDAGSGLPVRRWWTPDSSVEALAFRADGQQLVAADGRGRTLAWQVTTGELEFDLPPPPDAGKYTTTTVCLSPDGRRTAVARWEKGTQRTILGVRELPAGEESRRLAVWTRMGPTSFSPLFFPPPDLFGAATALQINVLPRGGSVQRMVFDPEGRLLAFAGGEPLVQVWDTFSDRLLPPVGLPGGVAPGNLFKPPVFALGPKAKWLAVGNPDGSASVWDLAVGGKGEWNGKPFRQWDGHSQAVGEIAFSSDGAGLVTVSQDGTAVLRRLTPDNVPSRVLVHGAPPIADVIFFGDGKRLAALDEGGTVRVWDRGAGTITPEVRSEKPAVKATRRPFHHNWIALDAGGSRVATIAFDHSVCVMDLQTHQTVCEIPAILNGQDTVTVYSLALSPDGRLLATVTGAPDNRVRVYEVDSAGASGPRELTGGRLKHNGPVYSVAFSPDGQRVASASSDLTARVWNVSAPEESPLILKGHTGGVTRVAFDRSGKTLGTLGADKTVRLWDLTTPKPQPPEEAGDWLGKEILNVAQRDVTPSHIAFGAFPRLAIVTGGSVATYLYDADELMRLAEKRQLRPWTKLEEKKHLHGLEARPVPP
jgi:WD40 repeat protein